MGHPKQREHFWSVPTRARSVDVHNVQSQTSIRGRSFVASAHVLLVFLIAVATVALIGRVDPNGRGKTTSVKNMKPESSRLRVAIFGTRVTGVLSPQSRVSVTLTSITGTVKGNGWATADARGSYALDTYDPRTIRDAFIEPGDILQVEVSDRPTFSAMVPKLSARTDPAEDNVSGFAPIGSHIKVGLTYDSNGPLPSEAQVEQEITNDDLGVYEARFRGITDIRSGMGGVVVVTTSEGNEFQIGWAAVKLKVRLGTSSLTGSGPSGRNVSVTLSRKGGNPIPVGGGRISGSGLDPRGAWSITLVDQSGDRFLIKDGDTLNVVCGDDTLQYVVPLVQASMNPAIDFVAGSVSKIGEGLLTIAKGSKSITSEITSDANGFFDFYSGDSWDLSYDDRVELSLNIDAHDNILRVRDQCLMLDLDQSVLNGSVEPGQEITVVIQPASGAQTFISKTLVTEGDATFSVRLTETLTGSQPLATGDRVVVISKKANAGKGITLTLTTPELTMSTNYSKDMISGKATPGGRVKLTLRELDEFGDEVAQRSVFAHPDDNGRYSVPVNPRLDALKNYRITGTYEFRNGYLTRRELLVKAGIGSMYLPSLRRRK
jgi:hypothetical protein